MSSDRLDQARALHGRGQLAQAAVMYYNRGCAHQARGERQAAREDYDRALALDATLAEAYCNRSVVLLELGQAELALQSAEQAIELKRNFPEAHYNRGNILLALGRAADALVSYDQAIALRADYAAAHFNRGNVLRQIDRPDLALASYERAVEIRPDFAEALANRGTLLQQLERWDEALESYDRAIRFQPGMADLYVNRGAVLIRLERFAQAFEDCDRALILQPACAGAYCNRGNVQLELRQWSEAIASFDRSIALEPRSAEAYYNRGNALRALGRLQEAIASYDQALARRAAYPEALCNRGLALAESNRSGEALASYDEAIQLRPGYPQALYNRSFTLLLRGDLARGWRDLEWRWHRVGGASNEERRSFEQPRWSGEESLLGRRILLCSEQGFGDTLQFCRFVPLLAQRGAHVILEVQPALVSLLRTLEGAAHVLARGERLPAFDCWSPLMSLPLAMGIDLNNLPRSIPYIQVDPHRSAIWRDRLGSGSKKRVGLVWSGGFRADRPDMWAVNERRNIPFAQLAPLAHPQVEYYSLQKGEPAESELATYRAQHPSGLQLKDCTARLEEFADTAALIDNLDLVIGVDTAVIHLAGALGRPAWLLNRFDSCWRWLLERSDSPWYPTLSVYRQPRAGAWDEVIERVRQDLGQWVAGS